MTQKQKTHHLAVAAMLSAVAAVLQFVEFSIPIMPSFIKLDISDLPALLGTFSLGPVYGVAIQLVKNLLHLPFGSSAGVGELSNFILGAIFVFAAGMFYRYMCGRRGALIGSLCGAAAMAIISVFSNYSVVSPVYTAFMPMDVILSMYQAINPNVKTLWDALIWFNMPFTFIKGMISVVITFLIYKKLSPLLKGKKA